MQRPDVPSLARGKWKGILQHFGVEDRALSGRNCPCPVCGGRDRFRFDNKEGRGTFICTHCGAGDGFKLLELVKGWDFKVAVREVGSVIGAVAHEQPRPERSDEEKRQSLERLWKSADPFKEGDASDLYLRSRGIVWEGFSTVRTIAHTRYDDGVYFAAMLAVVQGEDGKAVNVHRTFLKDGRKAPVDDCRRLMPGALPPGCAIRLGPANAALGIAEGIETALAASILFELPVWSAINADVLSKWTPPPNCEELTIFADHDAKYAGQAAAYALAKRLAHKGGIEVTVRMPKDRGDWADVLQQERAKAEVLRREAGEVAA